MISDLPVVRIPEPILESALMRQGGFAVYEGLPGSLLTELFNEAHLQYLHATPQESWEEDTEEVRGGTPKRSLLTAEAGPVQDTLYRSGWLADFLSDTCGVPVVPSGNRGSYSYYARPGDFLDLHRDIETCDVAMITGLHDNSDPCDQAGGLVLYPNRIYESLSAIRARPNEGAGLVKLTSGQSIIMLGGVVPHRVLPVRQGQVRIISVLCFRALITE